MAHRIRVGCSGWVYESWTASFYPPGLPASRRLAHYASAFDTVELNATFYRLARPGSAARWVEQTPPDFVFAAKASRYLTHMKRLTDLERGIDRYYASIAPLVARRRSCGRGRRASQGGRGASTSTPTSTTTGRRSRRATRCGCARCSGPERHRGRCA